MTTETTLRTRRLGRTELQVTELSLGGYMFTGEFGVPRAEATAILDAAVAAGINLLDTAEMYGFGEGEELVGRALRRHADRSLHVSTKIGWLDRTCVRHLGDAAYADEDALRRALEHSFWLLQRDYLDIVMVHEPNLASWWGQGLLDGTAPVLRVLEAYRDAGKIGAIGLGTWDCDNLADLLDTGRFDVALVAGGYTLIRQPVRARVLAAAKRHDVGLIMGGTFLQGALATVQRAAMTARLQAGGDGQFDAPTLRRILAVYDLCEETGLPITTLALRYILADPAIATVIPGAQQVAHLCENLAAVAAGPLPAELIARIDAISALG